MPGFKEYFLQHIWRHQLFDKNNLKTSKGVAVSIIKPGVWNHNSGPDFLNAEISIDGLKWYGSVEVHLKSSDWKRHLHDGNKNYDNVVLHVVWQDDMPELQIPAIELQTRIPKKYIENFDKLIKSEASIPCAAFFNNINSIFKTEMLEKAFFQRISRKTDGILDVLSLYQDDWEQTTYHLLLKNFGFKINEDAFGNIAQNLPFKILLKHQNSILQLEALLFGVAGLLEEDIDEIYYKELKSEYKFLKLKYQLQEIDIAIRFLRLRPANFPTIRLAQFADLVRQQSHLFSLFNDSVSYQKLAHQLKCKQSEYWVRHYTFKKPAEQRVAYMGKSSIDLIIINTLVPLLISYAKYRNDHLEKIDMAIQVLHQIKPEINHKIKIWEDLDFSPLNAYDSQAMIEWVDTFCLQKKCLDCSVGVQILKA